MSNMFLNVVSTFKGDGITSATRQLGAFGSAAGGLGSTLGKVGAALASFGLAAKGIEFTKQSIDSARDLERNLFSVNTIFEDMAPVMVQFSKDAENIGLSQKDAAKASVFLGSVLKQSGFAMGDVVTESQKLVSLGVDLAATYGYDVQEALLGMTALFRGEYDPIEKFGVAMKQSEINAELAARGLDKLEGEQRRLAEQTIRMELLYERAADATGAFSAQSGNLFVEQKKLQAQWENMQAQIGNDLLPVMGGLVAALSPLVDDLTPRLAQVVADATPVLEALVETMIDMSDETTTTGQTFSTLADALGTAFRIVAENLGLIVQLAGVFLAARTAVALFGLALKVTPFGAAITLIGTLAGSVLIATDNFKKYRKELERVGDVMTGAEKDMTAFLVTATNFNPTFDPVITLLQRIIREVLILSGALDGLPKEVVIDVRLETRSRNKELSNYLSFLSGRNIEAGGTGKVSGNTTTTTGTGSGSPAAAAVSAIEQLQKTQSLGVKKAEAQGKLLGLNLEQGVVDQILSMAKPVKSANEIFESLTKKNGELSKKGIAAVAKYNADYNAGIEQVNKRNAEAAQAAIAQAQEAERLAEQLRQAEKARIDGLNQLYANFLDTIKGTFAGIRNAIQGAFDITGLGGSTNAIIRNMNKLLAKMKSFSANVKSLATMGLDPALLQQVIQAGPVAGSRLAAALVSGGAGALASINAGFGQVGSLASEIATTGVQSLFDTNRQQSVYNITVTGGVGSGSTIGKAIVDAIKDYERTSGAVWQGA
jgi:hypothetical protein